ncbi:MAG: translation initiation factor IF-2 [Peptoniphilaceae bacterium]|nr:translation initiation factor IF-2 [Peptoniphilaceae bacterium]MDY6085543.1 translation initiation factor IF-2 [Peptoniphilaceae bacterium]
MRVYELAKLLGKPSKALRNTLEKEFGLTYPSHMSSMEDSDVQLIKEYFSEDKEAKKQEKAVTTEKTQHTEKKNQPKRTQEVAEDADDEMPRHEKKKEGHEKHRAHQTDAETSQPVKKNRKKKNQVARKEAPAAGKKDKKNKKREEKSDVQDDFDAIIEIPPEITVGDFAKAIHKNSMEVITALIKMGVMAGLNESITFETAEKVAESFGVLITEPEAAGDDEIFADLDEPDSPESLKPRPPVVTVMGHVDHGKTSLLDAIRETAVTRGEAGGITQHIGASVAQVDGQTITFIDTPGHEAFTQMRSRGASTTDIVILVVAADDGVMPQTVEAINHAKAAGVPIVVAINKIDRDGADPNRVMTELTEQGLIAEEWGGDTIMVPVSAKTHEGLDDLLQMVLMVAEMEELKANPNRPAVGVVIEAQLEKGRGATASVLVQRGTLSDKDYVVSGEVSGHIRAMFDSKGKKVKKAGPSMPVKITGLSDLPEAGDKFYAVADEKIARSYAAKVEQRNRNERLNKTTHISLDDLHMQISEEGLKELNIIVKTDVKGTIDALAGSIAKLSNDEVKVNIIHGAVGGISESDVMLAAASNAIIIGFNVRPNQGAIAQAEREEIDIHTYRVIYEALDDIEKAIRGMLSPVYKEEVLGRCEVRDTFKVPNAGTVAGIYVTSGKIVRHAKVRLLRDDIVIHEGTISSLRRFKDDVKEVASGYEGGLGIENYNDIKVGDVIECYHDVEVPVE